MEVTPWVPATVWEGVGVNWVLVGVRDEVRDGVGVGSVPVGVRVGFVVLLAVGDGPCVAVEPLVGDGVDVMVSEMVDPACGVEVDSTDTVLVSAWFEPVVGGAGRSFSRFAVGEKITPGLVAVGKSAVLVSVPSAKAWATIMDGV